MAHSSPAMSGDLSNGHSPTEAVPEAGPSTAAVSAFPGMPSPSATLSGNATPRSSLEGVERLSFVEHELAVVKQEKEVLGNQYRNLLGKLTAMRQSLGEKLREDAEELDRRESTINHLLTENSSLQSSVATLRTELVNAGQESANLQGQLGQLRSQSDSSSSDVLSLTREMRELRGEMERLRLEREEWEGEAGMERQRREAMEDDIRQTERREREGRMDWERGKDELLMERERAGNLQEVLGEFQAAKDSEIRQAVSELETQLRLAATSLSEFKLRTANAETRLAEVSNDASRSLRLEKELRDKNHVIGKLRHDAVVNNEHLTEALRRLRKSSSDTNVDRRLVTNILLAFLAAYRGDSKRFEMLSLLSTILGWDDTEREKAGLQRIGGPAGKGFGSKTSMKDRNKQVSAPGERTAEEEAAMNESFSNLFVEFLLKEASQGQPSRLPISPITENPFSPIRSPPAGSLSSISPPPSGANTPRSRPRRLSSSSNISNATSNHLASYPDRPQGLPNIGRKGSYNLQQALHQREGG